MFSKAIVMSAFLATSVLAAPTSSAKTTIEKRADWQPNKCEAGIHLNTSNGLEAIAYTSKWELSIIDPSGAQVAQWGGTNPADINIATTKGFNFVIEGQPEGSFPSSAQDSLTLSYDTQKWNGNDCYRYIQKVAQPSNGWRHQYDWWCQFDC
ncbi:hypothetical protein Q7P37_010051 [Cladosporium fusiforme]